MFRVDLWAGFEFLDLRELRCLDFYYLKHVIPKIGI